MGYVRRATIGGMTMGTFWGAQVELLSKTSHFAQFGIRICYAADF